MLSHDYDAVFAERVQAALLDSIQQHTKMVASGDCKTMDEYGYKCGIISGLKAAARYIDAELKKVNQ